MVSLPRWATWMLQRLSVPVLLVAAWQAAKSGGLIPYANVPAPIDVFGSASALFQSGELMHNTLHTLYACVSGWVIGSIIGLALGLVLGMFTPVWRWSMASFDLLRAIPAIAFVPIAVIIFAQTIQTEIVVVIWVSIWPVLVNTVDGFNSVSSAHHQVSASLRLSRFSFIRKIVLPSALPSILVALRLGLAFAFVLTIVAEMVGNPDGIGDALMFAKSSLHPEIMIFYILETGALGLILNYSIVGASHLFAPGIVRNSG